MSDKKKCPFCEAIALQRFIEEHHSKPAGFGMALSAALVSYAVVNGRKCGRTTDYMKDGKGYPLNYCPSCEESGRRMNNRQEKPPLKCLLGIDPEKTQKCKPSECTSCGWEAAEAAWRREYVKEHGLTLCADGFRRLIIRKEKDMATPYKECPLCGAHLDSGEKCECREEEIEAKNSQKYACGLTEQDVESGWECPLDNPNETVECCEDCAFAKETD
jgi:hypothetical protein